MIVHPSMTTLQSNSGNSSNNGNMVEDTMSSMYFQNGVIKDMSTMLAGNGSTGGNNSNNNIHNTNNNNNNSPQIHMQPYHTSPQQQVVRPQSQPPQQQVPPPPPPPPPPSTTQQQEFDGYSSALKEGYKDETFGTPDLGLLKRETGFIKQEEDAAEIQSSWYDSSNGADLGLDVFDWDNNDFVTLDDNEVPTQPSTSSENNKKSTDDKKLIDDSGKLCVVSL
ncbi:hypothetical protein BDF21DRAFT_429255 [Thamnidium elegans]|nr:hypothetical protein BDF21DRAFT_429255 [Thamnidium elegans]